MESFPSSPEWQPKERTTPEIIAIPPASEQIASMVCAGQEVQRRYGSYYLKPLPHRSNVQMMQMVDTRGTDIKLWFEHIEETAQNEVLVSHGVVDECERFLLFRHAISFEGILKPQEILSPQPLLKVTRLDRAMVNDSNSSLSRDEFLAPGSALAFSRFYEDILWLSRNQNA